jgi:uncharacterized membrane protein YgcG
MLKIKKLNSIVVVVVSLLFFNNQMAKAEENIQGYYTDIVINKDASVDIVETIEYNFGEKWKHGIFRIIPIKYLTAKNNWRKIRVSNLNVLLDNKDVKYKKSKQGRNLNIRIGDANKTITGQHEYKISYTVKGSLNYFPGYDELYWNVVGSEWEVPVEKSVTKISAPKIIKSKCFQGVYGSLDECTTKSSSGESIVFEFKPLQPEEEATVVIGIQKGIIDKLTVGERIGWFLMDNWVLFLPVITLFWAGRRWWKYGRDPEGQGTIIPYYDTPNKLSVAESSVVMYNGLRSKDISAMIIQLAVKGFIKIKQAKEGKVFKHTKYIFYKSEKYKNKNNKLTDEEEFLFKALFEFGDDEKVTTDNLKDKFYKKVSALQSQSLTAVKNRNYLPKKLKYNGITLVIVGVVQMILLALSASLFGSMAVFSGVMNLVILVFFAFFMGHRTKEGVIAKEKLLGLKLYLETAEKDRIKFHNAPSKNPQQFEKLLPYAMIFGVEKEWAEQFKNMYNEPPDWYQGTNGQVFNSVVLANSLSSFNKITSGSVASAPSSASSGGSGFSGGGSGGGFGGGGGGSW